MPRFAPRLRAPASLAPVLLAAVLFAACASRPVGAPPLSEPSANMGTQVVVGGGGAATSVAANTMSTGPAALERAVAVSADTAFLALLPAYQSLGMTPNTVVGATRTIGVREGEFRRALGRRRLSEFLDCGYGVTGGSNADEYTVRMTVMSRVTPAPTGTGSVVATQVVASAQPSARSGDPVRCASNGRLEQAVNAALAVQAAAR